MVDRALSRRRFLAGSAVSAAQLGLLALAGPAGARRALQPPTPPTPPTPTVAPVATRHALKRLLVPLPAWIRHGPTDKARAALTIDDMWGDFGADNANAAMDVARAKGVKLTFFPTGGALEEHIELGRQDVWRRAVADGHDIGNHTYTHTALTKLTDDQIRGELDHTRDLLAQCLGPEVPYTMRLMRPPGGAGGLVDGGDPRILNVVKSLGYSMTMWTVDANGVKGNAAYVNKIMRNARNGMIILVHFTEFTPEGLSILIDRLRGDKHLEPTSITGLFG